MSFAAECMHSDSVQLDLCSIGLNLVYLRQAFFCTECYTHITSKFRIQLELETPLGKAVIEDNSYSIVEINNVA